MAGFGKSTSDQSEVKRLAFLAEHASRNFLDPSGALMAILPDTPTEQASARASQLLKHPESVKLLKKIQGELMERISIDSERITQELACIAFFDPIDLMDDYGNLKPLSAMPEHARRAIASLDVSYDSTGNQVKKVKTESKKPALELLGKNIGMFIDRKQVEVTGTLGERLIKARKRTTKTSKSVDDSGASVMEETILEEMME